jgi:glutaconate CoA-transferase subunit B
MAKNYVKPGEYSIDALMVLAASREVKNKEIIFAGTGLPMIATMLAKSTHAPDCISVYEAGTIDNEVTALPASVGGPRLIYKPSTCEGMYGVFGLLQRGYADLGFLGGAEVDRFGNINCTCIGDYLKPDKRLPGPGGNPDINALAKRVVYIMNQEARRFSEHVSYVTSAGWRVKRFKEDGSFEYISRQECFGSNFRGGPSAIITNMAIFRFRPDGEIYLDTFHPGFSVRDVRDNISFDMDLSRCRGETERPTYEELDLLYKVIDPEGLFLK